MSASVVVRFRCNAPGCGACVDVDTAAASASPRTVQPPDGWASAFAYGSDVHGCPGKHAEAVIAAQRELHAWDAEIIAAQNAAVSELAKRRPEPKRPAWLSRIRGQS